MTRRFRVAFSFTGEKRRFIDQVARLLAAQLGEEKVLYDKFHEAEFARRDLGLYLPELYKADSDLVVVAVCFDYEKKPWTGLEWVAIHDILSQQEDHKVMLCRFANATVKGLSNTSGFVDLDDKTPQDLVNLILRRLALNDVNLPESTGPISEPARPAFSNEELADQYRLVFRVVGMLIRNNLTPILEGHVERRRREQPSTAVVAWLQSATGEVQSRLERLGKQMKQSFYAAYESGTASPQDSMNGTVGTACELASGDLSKVQAAIIDFQSFEDGAEEQERFILDRLTRLIAEYPDHGA
jgi:hypothetical protein